MNQLTALAMTTTALLRFGAGVSSSDSLAQQKSLKEQLVVTQTERPPIMRRISKIAAADPAVSVTTGRRAHAARPIEVLDLDPVA